MRGHIASSEHILSKWKFLIIGSYNEKMKEKAPASSINIQGESGAHRECHPLYRLVVSHPKAQPFHSHCYQQHHYHQAVRIRQSLSCKTWKDMPPTLSSTENHQMILNREALHQFTFFKRCPCLLSGEWFTGSEKGYNRQPGRRSLQQHREGRGQWHWNVENGYDTWQVPRRCSIYIVQEAFTV